MSTPFITPTARANRYPSASASGIEAPVFARWNVHAADIA